MASALSVRLVLLCLLALIAGSAAPRIDIPFVRQVEQGCGAASLAMVMGYWTQQQPAESQAAAARIYAELREPESGGIRLAAMKEYLRAEGFRAFTFPASRQELKKHVSQQRPVIVGLRHGSATELHFVVVTGFDDKGLWLHDPARSKPKHVKRLKFEKRWAAGDGWLLLAMPGN